MKELRAKVEDLSQRSFRYRLINDSGSKAAVAEQSNSIAAAMFGIDNARRAAKQDNHRVHLVQLISEEDEDPKVIAVWGTSGNVGQASIIREAYEHPDVRSKFPVRAWVRVTDPFSLKGFIQSLVNQFHARSAKGIEDLLKAEKIEQDLAQIFNGYINDDRCLIVLNNLSTIEEWDQIVTCFRNIKKGSRIIVSTAQVEVASLCAGPEGQASELNQLSADQTLYAFYDKGYKNGKDSVEPMSSSHATTSSTNDHTMAEIIEDQSEDADEKNVKKSFKRIKTNAGALQESQLIGREKEIAKINELISSKDSQQVHVISVYGMGGLGKTTLVDVVYHIQKISDRFEKCVFVTIMRPFDLSELLRSLVVRLHEASSKKDELMDRVGMKKTWAMMGVEELTKEFARLIGTKSCLIVLDDLSSFTEWDLIRPIFLAMEKTSRIIVTTRHEDIAKHCSGEHGKIHNLKVLEHKEAMFLFSEKMRFLRVLDLEGVIGLVAHHLEHIGKLLHLKYLSLRNSDEIFGLPDSVGNLRQLETLDIRDTAIMILPKTIIKLQKLQYVHAGRKSTYVKEKRASLRARCIEFLEGCPALCALCCAPSIVEIDGCNRRDACTFACCVAFPVLMKGIDSVVMVPRGMRKLKNLHTLRVVNVGRGTAVLQDIERLTGLRKLGVTGINNKNGQAFCSALSSLSRLESLSVWSVGKPGLCGCLDGLSLPPMNLQSLKLYGNLETLPEWIKKLEHLVKLKLVATRLLEHDVAMELLGSLPKLDILGLVGRAFQSEELHFQSRQTEIAFGSLRVLMLSDKRHIKSVKFEKGAMPKLEQLLLRCMESELGFSGLEFLPSISEVQLTVSFDLDWDRIFEGSDSRTQSKIHEEELQESRRKETEYKKKLRDQLAGISRQPILTV
ncbi:hypothetical protein EJB05_42482, partial [Eragrostis curvula]